MSDLLTPSQLGWDDAWAAHLRPGETAGRVLVTHRGSAEVCTPEGVRTLVMPDPIAIAGDWVTVLDEEHRASVGRVLPRTSLIRRRAANDVGDQFLAANVDTCFLTTSLNQDFNVRRLLRFSALVGDSGAEAVAVLTKADLCPDLWGRVAEVERLMPTVPVIATSAVWGLDGALDPWLGPGRTVAFLGTSGVGKSSLVNALLGEEVQVVKAQREDDDRGRHTTVRRELLVLPDNLGCVLDTPGIRAVGVDSTAAVRSAFADIEALAEQCRFRDCEHDSEPGCAIDEAIATGELTAERLKNWQKLLREAARHEAKAHRKRAGQRRRYSRKRYAGERFETEGW